MKIYKHKIWIIILMSFLFIVTGVNATIPMKSAGEIENLVVPVLCYHRIIPKISSIYDLTPTMLEKQFQFFKANGYHPITALQYLKLQKYPQFFPDKPVVLTFDDGHKSHYQYVFPLLKKYGFKATFFIFPEVVSNHDYSHFFITWNELAEMYRDGMDIEAHTFSHPFLTSAKTGVNDPGYLKWLDHELKDSKKIIEQRLKITVELLAYPYGWFNRIVEKKVIEAGYHGAFSVNWGVNLPDENPFRLKRRTISKGLNLRGMQQYLTSRFLSLKVISPTDASILTEAPEIKFKLSSNNVLPKVEISVDDDQGRLNPDDRGIYTFTKFKTIRSGYYMIIVSGYDHTGQLYINSWGFDYQKPSEKGREEQKSRKPAGYE